MDIIGTICAVVFIFLLFTGNPFAWDDSDDKVNNKRSGMVVYTDHLTGCQYLSGSGLGQALTPRLDREGSHICITKQEK